MLSPYISIRDGHIYCELKGEHVTKCPCCQVEIVKT